MSGNQLLLRSLLALVILYRSSGFAIRLFWAWGFEIPMLCSRRIANPAERKRKGGMVGVE